MKVYQLVTLAIVIFAFYSIKSKAQTKFQLKSTGIQTRWAKEVSPGNALNEYPLPLTVRENWQNLNGRWSYTITAKDSDQSSAFDDQLLVSFATESALSNVKNRLLPMQDLWYKRSFTSAQKERQRTFLHFGAVDWQATVFVNGKEVRGRTECYTAFTINITNALKAEENELVVKAYDSTDQGIGPHGTQVLHSENICYPASSSIWQTAWLENVPADYISDLKLTPDIDKGMLNTTITLSPSKGDANGKFEIEAMLMSQSIETMSLGVTKQS